MYAACSTDALGFPLSASESAAAIAQSGFESIVFNQLRREMSLPLPQMQALLAAHKLTPAAFKLDVEFRDSQAAFEQSLEAFVPVAEYAHALHIPCCFSFVKPFSQTLTYLENFALHRTRLEAIARLLASYDMTLALEFVGPPSLRIGQKYTFIHTLEEMQELIAAIGTGNCTVLLDAYHWDLALQTDDDFQKLSAKEIGLVHVNDAPAGIPAAEQEDMCRCMPGETGVLRIGAFLDGIRRTGYQGPVVCEPFSRRLRALPFSQALAETTASFAKIGVPLHLPS